MTDPSGARLPRGKVTVLVSPRCLALGGRENHVVGLDSVALPQHFSQSHPAFGPLPPFEHLAQAHASDGESFEPQQAECPQMEHQFGDSTRQEEANRRMAHRPVGQHVDQPRHAEIDAMPVFDGRPS